MAVRTGRPVNQPQQIPALTDESGSFSLAGLGAGTYSLTMVEIAANAKLELLGLVHGSTVSGTVTRNGEAVAGALALLAPRKESANPLDYRGFQTDSDGSFEFEGLAVGEYVLIVLEEWGDFEYANPAAVRPYLETGRAVRLESGQNQQIRVELK